MLLIFYVIQESFPSNGIFLLSKKCRFAQRVCQPVGKGEFYFFMVSQQQPTRAIHARVRHLEIGCRVSGKFGDLLPFENSKRWKRARLFGNVIDAVDANKYRVLFDNAVELECFSNSLRLE
jgi:hypothetical protein